MVRLSLVCLLIASALGCSPQKGVEMPKETKPIVAAKNPVQK